MLSVNTRAFRGGRRSRRPETGAVTTVCVPYYDWESEVTESVCWTEDVGSSSSPAAKAKAKAPKPKGGTGLKATKSSTSSSSSTNSAAARRAGVGSSGGIGKGAAIAIGLGVAFGGWMLLNRKSPSKR